MIKDTFENEHLDHYAPSNTRADALTRYYTAFPSFEKFVNCSPKYRPTVDPLREKPGRRRDELKELRYLWEAVTGREAWPENEELRKRESRYFDIVKIEKGSYKYHDHMITKIDGTWDIVTLDGRTLHASFKTRENAITVVNELTRPERPVRS